MKEMLQVKVSNGAICLDAKDNMHSYFSFAKNANFYNRKHCYYRIKP